MEEQESREVKPDIFKEIFEMAYSNKNYAETSIYPDNFEQRPLLKLMMHEFCEYINSNQDASDIVESILTQNVC